MAQSYHRDEAAQGPMVLERLSDLDEARDLLGDFKDIRGMTVINPQGDDVGSVTDLYMDPKQGKLVMASISFGGVWGFGAKNVLVPMDQLEIVNEDHIRVVTTPEIVKNAPEFNRLEGGDFSNYCSYWNKAKGRAKSRKAA